MTIRIIHSSRLTFTPLLVILALACRPAAATAQKSGPQRVIVIMMDGFGDDYYQHSDMPTLRSMAKKGIYKVVPSLMPSVTNVNNASIVTGVTPDVNGITGNVFINPATGREQMTEDPDLVMAPTLFERAHKAGVRSMLLSCKTKTVRLLNRGADDTLAWETASADWVGRLGPKPDIYSREVNYWMMEAALYTLRHDPGIGVLYIHTTDYPMHTWAPESPESREHLRKMDDYLARLIQLAPDAAILITADHTVHHKSLCWDLEKACANRGVPVKAAINPEKDKYFRHHMGMGGSEYIYLKSDADRDKIRDTILRLKGVREVITREEAVNRYHLMPERIGDLMVLADSMTVFGQLESAESQELPAAYRTHGSTYEARVPVFIYNAKGAPGADYFTANYKLAAWLYR